MGQLICLLLSGRRLKDPEFCPWSISKLLRNCFQKNPNSRPNFAEIREYLKRHSKILHEQLTSDNTIDKNKINSLIKESNTATSAMETQYTKILKDNTTTFLPNDSEPKDDKQSLIEDNNIPKHTPVKRS